MFKQISKKIAVGVNLLLLLQSVSLGVGVIGAHAEDVKENTDSVVKVELVKAGVDYTTNDVVIQELKEGDVINLSELPAGLNLLATTDPAVISDGSVRFDFDDYAINENLAPYALAGDQSNEYKPTDLLTVGKHSLSVTPYDLKNGTGNAGTSLNLDFSVIDAPVVLDKYAPAYLLNDQVVVANPILTIPVEFNEKMDNTITPVMTIDPEISTSVVEDTTKSGWVSDTEYNFVYNLLDANVEVPVVSMTVSGAQDLAGNIQLPFKYSGKISIDTKNPTVYVTADPANVNDASKYTKVTFTSNEMFGLAGTGISFAQAGKITELDVPADAPRIDGKTLSFTVPKDKFSGKEKIVITANFKDEVGNETGSKAYELVPDVTAPLSVTGLSAKINPDNTITVSWENPNDPKDYDKIIVYRNDVPVYVLDKGVNVFGDVDTQPGKTYTYKIALVDAAGNTTETTGTSVSVPEVKVAAVASDSFVPVSNTQSEVKPAEQEVKAETTENENKNQENDKKNSLPLWGLLLLVVLALVGGYLFLTDNKKTLESKKVNAKVKVGKTKK